MTDLLIHRLGWTRLTDRPDGHLCRMILQVIILYHLCRINLTLNIIRGFIFYATYLQHTNNHYDNNANVMRQFVNDYTDMLVT